MILKTINSRIAFFFSLFFSVIFVFASYITLQITIRDIEDSIETNAKNFLLSIRNLVETQHQSIIFHQDRTLAHRQNEISNLVDVAISIVDHHHREYLEGNVSLETAQEHVILHFEATRYGDGIGYYWINDTGKPFPRMIIHPIMPELNGTVLDNPDFNNALGNEENLFRAFVNITEESGSGFVDYLWPKPAPEGPGEVQPKLSYVARFDPWNWIVGTGVYIDDIEKEVNERINKVLDELNDAVKTTRIGESGYFFIFSKNGDVLVHPSLAGQNLSDRLNPSTGNSLVNDLMDAEKTESRTLVYKWDKPGYENNFEYIKTAYISFYEPLEWYIASTYYHDDMNRQIDRIRMASYLVGIISLVLIALLSLVFSRHLVKPIVNLNKMVLDSDELGIPHNKMPVTGTSEIRFLAGSMNNMIERIRESTKDLLESRMQFSQISENINELFYLFSQDFSTAFYINPIVETIWGIERDTVYKNPWSLFDNIAEEDRDVVFHRRSNLISEASDRSEVFTYRITVNNEEKWISEKMFPVFIEGKLERYAGLASDITMDERQKALILEKNRELLNHKSNLEQMVIDRTAELMESLDELKLTQDKLIESEKLSALGRLVAGVAHEVNTPVGIGVTAASHLEQVSDEFHKKYQSDSISKKDFEEFLLSVKEFSALILSNMNKASQLIKNFKQIAVDQVTEEKRTFSLIEYINETVASARSKFKNTGYRINVEGNEDLTIHAAPGLFYQIIINLLMNSLQHGFDDMDSGTIDIILEEAGSSIVIIYRDSGKGIPLADQDKIFEPFFTTKRGFGGTGLGLNIVYNIVRKGLSGQISCISEEGLYTEFRMEIPRTEE